MVKLRAVSRKKTPKLTAPMGLEIVDQKRQHFIVYSKGPCRIEVMRAGKAIIMYGYQGLKTNMCQEPTVLYFGDEDGNGDLNIEEPKGGNN